MHPSCTLPDQATIRITGCSDSALVDTLLHWLQARQPGITIESDPATRADLHLHIATPVTMTPDLENRLQSAPTIHPYPDYADHINLRILADSPPEVLLLTGSQRAAWHAVGLFMQQMQITPDNRLTLTLQDRDWQPHTPVRGIGFTEPPPRAAEIVRQQALWGDNVTSLPADITPLLSWHNPETIRWLRLDSPEDLATLPAPPRSETWLDVSLWDEPRLDALCQATTRPDSTPVRAILYGPHDTRLDQLRHELPFHVQLITLVSLQAPLDTIARQYALRAPMTYGSIGLAPPSTPSWKRFVWSTFAGTPQPDRNDALHTFAGMLVHTGLSPTLVQAIQAAEQHNIDQVETLAEALPAVPLLDEIRSYASRREP